MNFYGNIYPDIGRAKRAAPKYFLDEKDKHR